MAALHILKSRFVSRAMVALLLLELPGHLSVDITLLFLWSCDGVMNVGPQSSGHKSAC